MTPTKQDHIAMMQRNLKESEARLAVGKITPTQYRHMARDVKKRISEIRAEPDSLWRGNK